MLHQDFLMRMIQTMVEAFSRLVRMRGEAPEQAKAELEDVLADQFDTRRELLFAQPFESLERFDRRACAYIGKLFGLHAQVCRDLGRVVEAQESLGWAIRAYRRALEGGNDEPTREAESALTELLRSDLVDELAPTEMVRASYASLYEFAERHERLPEAEDALFAGLSIGLDPSYRERGRRLFASAVGRSEEYYLEHGLSAGEVSDLVTELSTDEPDA